jgi:hemerythrin-like domain-containing protein
LEEGRVEIKTLSTVLEEDHRAIDRDIEAFIAASGVSAPALSSAVATLRRHIYLEEEILFPMLGKGGIEMPLFVMRREHGVMWPVMDVLDGGVEAGADADVLVEESRGLLLQLQAHNPKEESIVYAAADETLDEEQRRTFAAAFGEAQLPPGWVCEAVRGR